MKRRILAMLSVLALSASLVACGSDKKGQEGDGADSNQESQETAIDSGAAGETAQAEELPAGMYRSELTNELIDEKLKDQRPIAVMVDNESIALPHYGLSRADVVYEMMNSTMNGRITRLMALFKDYEGINQIGSIRSVRPTNVILASEWNAILCHDGGPFYIDEYIADPSVDNFSGTFSRVSNGKAREYTEYVLAGDMDKNFENSDVSRTYTSYYEGPHYQFASEDSPETLEGHDGVEDAGHIALPFPHNSSELTYNEDTKLYEYSEYGDAHLDPGNDNAPLAFKNVLIQSCGFTQLDKNGYMIFDCINTGYGYYATNGKAIYVSWMKEDMTSPTRYYDEVGNEIKLNTGKTYVGLVPVDDWEDLVIE